MQSNGALRRRGIVGSAAACWDKPVLGTVQDCIPVVSPCPARTASCSLQGAGGGFALQQGLTGWRRC
jgi:hypothetical protein